VGITYLGPFNASAKACSQVTQVFNRALGNCHWDDDINAKLWLKLMINVAINPLSAIFQVNNGALAQPSFQSKIDTIVNEAMPLLRALQLEASSLRQIINQVIDATASNYSSMNRDIHFQRHTENAYISGYLLDKASAYQIDMPFIRSLYHEITRLENHSPTQSNTH